MRKIILLGFLTLVSLNGYSQEKGGFRVGLDFGFVPTGGGGGGMLSIEPKYNIEDNMNVGLRIGGAGIARDIESNAGGSTTAEISANSSFIGTYDYYLDSGNSFVPYIGAGLGYYSIANVEFDDSDMESDVVLNPEASGEMGGLVRLGFEWGKFRMGVEYNFIPDSTLQNNNGDSIGTVSNSYAGIHLGFFLGGGKWGK
ncbi:hypothetical protein D3C85_945230 [compost metagenome]